MGYEAALQRNPEAVSSERRGDIEGVIQHYKGSVAEEFVSAHPYERLAALYESRQNYPEALCVNETYISLARSGRLAKGSQRSADRKLPEFEARAERYGKHLKSP